MTQAFHIVVAMKPVEGTYASNALEHGVAGLNIDGCRVPVNRSAVPDKKRGRAPRENSAKFGKGSEIGRHPANILLDQRSAADMDGQGTPYVAGNMRDANQTKPNKLYQGAWKPLRRNPDYYGDVGGYSRVFQRIKEDDE